MKWLGRPTVNGKASQHETLNSDFDLHLGLVIPLSKIDLPLFLINKKDSKWLRRWR